jgi:hypothetical protein
MRDTKGAPKGAPFFSRSRCGACGKIKIAESDRDENQHWLKRLTRIARSRADKRFLAARTGHVAANRWQSAMFCGFAPHRSLRKTVSMEVLERRGPGNTHASAEIHTPVQSLATHASATRRTRDASFETKSGISEST